MQNVPTLNLRVPLSSRADDGNLISARSSRTSLSLALRPTTSRSLVRRPNTPPDVNDTSANDFISVPDPNEECSDSIVTEEGSVSLRALRESFLRSLSRASLSFETNYRLNSDFVSISPYSLITAFNTPPPEGIMYLCRILRTGGRSGLRRRHTYTLLTDSGKYIMSSRKCSGTRSSYFTITGGPPNTLEDKSHHLYLGKLRSNFLGSSYSLFSPGMNPKKASPTKIDPTFRKELVSIQYENTFLRGVPAKKGPRSMTVAAPSVTHRTDYYVDHQALQKAANAGISNPPSGIEVLRNKEPRWSSSVNGYVLNFSERVREPSVKNFLLVAAGDSGDVRMQFGKTGDNEYCLDFASPITPLAAFGIALSSLDFKLCCE